MKDVRVQDIVQEQVIYVLTAQLQLADQNPYAVMLQQAERILLWYIITLDAFLIR